MHRSVSWSRVSEDMHMMQKPAAPALRTTSISMDEAELSAYDLTDDVAKKEKSRLKFAENAVHLIPVVLLLCALVLWLCSDPNVELGIKAADSVAEKMEGLAMEGDIDTDNGGTQTSVLPAEFEDIDKPEGTNKVFRNI